jgi:hypothetical protein
VLRKQNTKTYAFLTGVCKKAKKMPSYKLIYFPVRFRAECARQIFAQAGEKYEDFHILFEKWPETKNGNIYGV